MRSRTIVRFYNEVILQNSMLFTGVLTICYKVDFSEPEASGGNQSFTSNGLRIPVLVGLSPQLGLSGQGGGGIFRKHDQFNQLHFFSFIELLVFEKSIQLGLRLDRIRNGSIFVLGEGVQELGVLPAKIKCASNEQIECRRVDGLPRSNIVILPMHTPDKPFDGVPVVVQDENDWGQLVGDHSRQLLNSELS